MLSSSGGGGAGGTGHGVVVDRVALALVTFRPTLREPRTTIIIIVFIRHLHLIALEANFESSDI